MGFGSDEEDEESEADPDDCFEKPWEYDQLNVMADQNHFQAQGSGDPVSKDLFAQPQNLFFAVANPVFSIVSDGSARLLEWAVALT